MSTGISPAIPISSSHCLRPYLYLLLFTAVSPYFSSWYTARGYRSLPCWRSWIKRALPSCSLLGMKRTLSNTVPLTNVFYPSTINNVEAEHARRGMPHIQRHLVTWDARRHSELDPRGFLCAKPEQLKSRFASYLLHLWPKRVFECLILVVPVTFRVLEQVRDKIFPWNLQIAYRSTFL